MGDKNPNKTLKKKKVTEKATPQATNSVGAAAKKPKK
ncbi:MAG: hypothetical protein K0R15_1549 [Clostridiales bacterium]|jgi:hypothetical protein|nr:hypothetical protein [Clostridiales bacterium]